MKIIEYYIDKSAAERQLENYEIGVDYAPLD